MRHIGKLRILRFKIQFRRLTCAFKGDIRWYKYRQQNYRFKKHCDFNKEQTVAFSVIDAAVQNKREGCVTLPKSRKEKRKREKDCFLMWIEVQGQI